MIKVTEIQLHYHVQKKAKKKKKHTNENVLKQPSDEPSESGVMGKPLIQLSNTLQTKNWAFGQKYQC